ncbi:phosphohistidine phosphatase [Geodermatophilus telluris]|uniref:Phosphohistidine phosphatase n=1 Tax=Geodermatophilus telluris TaxID=1190417 RepID=A0A1G6M1F9_9ACTN|nr:histidine phosphatase family protein [Geodermatophilus telluris]SDC49373.1 phosphohistidine phosphatase [Geodermatophilus telluris]
MQPHRLVLVRHAQAAAGPVDAERPLTDRGAQQAAGIGAWLARSGLEPDRVVLSPARRAVQTWERAATALGPDPRPVVDERVWDNTVPALLAVLGEVPEDVRTLAVVGHAPSVGELAATLDDGRGDPAARSDVRAGFPAGGVAVLLLATPWSALGPGGATLGEVALPVG